MPLPTDFIDGDVLSASDVNDITTAVNAIDLSPLESDISTLQGEVTTLDAAVELLTNVSTNVQTASYTLVLSDATKLVEMDVATAHTLIVPPNSGVAFPVGTQIIVVQTGAGATTLEAGSGVTLNSKDGNVELGGQFGGVTLIKRDTNNWLAVGDLA